MKFRIALLFFAMFLGTSLVASRLTIDSAGEAAARFDRWTDEIMRCFPARCLVPIMADRILTGPVSPSEIH